MKKALALLLVASVLTCGAAGSFTRKEVKAADSSEQIASIRSSTDGYPYVGVHANSKEVSNEWNSLTHDDVGISVYKGTGDKAATGFNILIDGQYYIPETKYGSYGYWIKKRVQQLLGCRYKYRHN